MSWYRVDDGFPEHPKLQLLERDPRLWADAMALWLSAGCYCRRAGTGGFISDARLLRLSPLTARRAVAVAAALVEHTRIEPEGAGLWLRVEGGYQIHDYPEYGPESERDEAPRAPASSPTAPLTPAERAARYRARKRREAVTETVTPDVTERDASRDAERDAERDERHVTPRAPAHLHARPDPTRPDQTHGASGPVTAVTRDAGRDARDVTRDVTRDAGLLAARESTRDRALAALQRGWSERYLARCAMPAPPAHLEQLRPLASWCGEYLDEHAELTPEALSEQLLTGFWRRADLKRPPAEWLAEDPARYLAAAAEAERAADRARRREQLEREQRQREIDADARAVPPPPEAAGLAALLRGAPQPAPPTKTRAERRADRQRELDAQREALRQRTHEAGA